MMLPKNKVDIETLAATPVDPPPRSVARGLSRATSYFGVGKSGNTLEQQKNHHRQVLQRLRASNVLKAPTSLDEIAVGHPEFAALLDKYDANNDGEIDGEELVAVLQELKDKKRQTDYLKYGLGFSLLFLCVLLLSNALLTVWMIKLTKEVYVDDSSDGLISSKGNMLKTEKPKYYTSISSVTSLPAGALDSISRMTFTTVDGGVYNLLVNGTLQFT